MGYTALYRKYRPMNFEEVVGQEHITRTLKNQIMANRVGHAYLFNGGRGTGKTSSAKILARAVNCLNPQEGEPCNECEICKSALAGTLTDIVEMDAASNNSVEDIRSIREEVNFLPTKAKYRVYIIDEVHMLSTGAFNALLKTLEEPPEHVKFILATTEPQKLPPTILSRCQRFDFKKIGKEYIKQRLEYICKENQIEITNEALELIAILAEGALRDALSILERCMQENTQKIDEDIVKDLVGIPKLTYIYEITKSIIEKNVENAIQNTNKVLEEGKDVNALLLEIIKFIKDVLILKISSKIDIYSQEEQEYMKNISEEISKEQLMHLIYELSELQNDLKWSTQKTILLEAGIIKLCSENNIDSNVEERINKIEKYIKNNQVSVNKISNNLNNTINIQKKEEETKPVFSNNIIQKPKEIKKEPLEKNTNINLEPEKFWPKVVNELKDEGKIVLYTNLINTKATKISDMTIGIEFLNGMTAFGKTVLEKPENKKEIELLVSKACHQEMNIKYITAPQADRIITQEEKLQNLAKESDIPFSITD